MMGRFMELFRSNSHHAPRDTVARDFERLRRANYERDDRERAAGVDFVRLARHGRGVGHGGRPAALHAAPAEPERRG